MTQQQENDILAGAIAMQILAARGYTYEQMLADLAGDDAALLPSAREYIETMERCAKFRFKRTSMETA